MSQRRGNPAHAELLIRMHAHDVHLVVRDQPMDPPDRDGIDVAGNS